MNFYLVSVGEGRRGCRMFVQSDLCNAGRHARVVLVKFVLWVAGCCFGCAGGVSFWARRILE